MFAVSLRAPMEIFVFKISFGYKFVSYYKFVALIRPGVESQLNIKNQAEIITAY